MVENPPVMVLETLEEIDNRHGRDAEVISFELDILGEPVSLRINVAQRQAKLSDIAPVARTLSTKLTLVMLERLRGSGQSVPCRKGCSACCSYLVPLSVPEALCLREEVLAMPADQCRAVLQSCLETAKRIFDHRPEELDINEWAQTNSQIEIHRLGRWYAGLELVCPFLSDSLCTLYKQRPLACREHIVTGSALSCEAASTDGSRTVQMPVSVLECLGRLTADLEQSDIEAVMLPLALPWAQENLERSRRTWPAVIMVERFIEILKTAASKNPAMAVAPA